MSWQCDFGACFSNLWKHISLFFHKFSLKLNQSWWHENSTEMLISLSWRVDSLVSPESKPSPIAMIRTGGGLIPHFHRIQLIRVKFHSASSIELILCRRDSEKKVSSVTAILISSRLRLNYPIYPYSKHLLLSIFTSTQKLHSVTLYRDWRLDWPG